ncbi:MAG: hypothetical protein M3R21_02250 [Candidatus Dormibacteraeota bacterium]|nr:hypothetical protein [Candidatus Dormibacteraeota bacterium]
MGPRGLVAALPLVAALALAAPAFGAGDPVANGSFHLKLSRSFKHQLRHNGVAMKPKAFSAKGGSIDPITGTGTLTLNGKLRFKHDHKKVIYKTLTATLGSNGVLKGDGVKLFKLRGGAVTRNGFGADISGVKASFLQAAAKKINKKLGIHSLQRASAGSLSVSEQPQTVEVTGGTAHLVPDPTTTAGSGTIASKLLAHCINGLSGVTAIGLGIKNPPALTPTFDFPVTGGTISPLGTDGVVDQAGGIQLANGGVGGSCASSTGVNIQQTNFAYNLLSNYISSHVVIAGSVPTVGDQGVVPGSNLDASNAAVSANPDDHSMTVNGTVIRFNKGSALVLNQTFAQPSPNASMEFASGDLFGTVDLTVTTR